MHTKIYLLLLFTGISSIYAQPSVIECDRPDQTETPTVVPHNHLQVESGFYFEKSSDLNRATLPACLIKYGIKDIAEFRFEIESPVDIHNTETHIGINPIAIGLKMKLCDEKNYRPKISIIAMSSIPILATKKHIDIHPTPEIRLLIQKSLSSRISISSNVGVLWSGESFTTTALYTITSGFVIREKWGSYIELYGFVPVNQRSSNFFDGGITYTPKNNIMLDISSGISIDRQKPDWWVGTGISFRLPN